MNEITEMYKEIKKDKQDRNANWKIQNTKILDESGIEYRKASDECYLFRGSLKVDFYPSTGRWKYNGKMFSGGARKFIVWYWNKMIEQGGISERS